MTSSLASSEDPMLLCRTIMPRHFTCFDSCTSSEFGRKDQLCCDRQCGQLPGTRERTFPSMSSRCCLRYSARGAQSRNLV